MSTLAPTRSAASRRSAVFSHGESAQPTFLDDEPRREKQALRRGFSWLVVGNVVNAACSWGRLTLLARWGNAEMIGQLALALAVCTPLSDFFDLGLSGALVSDARRQFRLRDYFGLRAITCTLTLVIIVALAVCGGYDPAGARLIVLAGLLVVCESACDIFLAVLQREERMRWVAISLIVRGTLGLTLFAAILWLSGSVAWSVCGFCLAAIVTLASIDAPRALACERRGASSAAQAHQESNDGSALRLTAPYARLAWLSLPLGLAAAGLSLTTSIPRYWIGVRLGHAALGGFAVAASLMVALALVVGALSQAACPRLARYHAAGNAAAFRRLLGQLALWLGVATALSVAVMALAGRQVVGLLFGPAFAPYAAIAACLMLAAGLRNYSILLGRALTSMRRFRTGLTLRLLGIAVLLLLLPGWLDWLGLMGAAWAITLSWLATALVSLAMVLQALKHCETIRALPPTHR